MVKKKVLFRIRKRVAKKVSACFCMLAVNERTYKHLNSKTVASASPQIPRPKPIRSVSNETPPEFEDKKDK